MIAYERKIKKKSKKKIFGGCKQIFLFIKKALKINCT